jgi:hypothetical protein
MERNRLKTTLVGCTRRAYEELGVSIVYRCLILRLSYSRRRHRKALCFAFPGWRTNKPLTGAACLNLLDDMKRPGLTCPWVPFDIP